MKQSLDFKVPFIDLKGQFLAEESDLIEIFKQVGRSGNLILGEGVQQFEKDVAEYCESKYAIGVGNGSDSLFFIMKALGIGPGDEVITQPNSFIATAWTIIATGATPVFVDVDETQSIDPSLVQRAITSKTRAIIPVHLAGNPCNMTELKDIAEQNGLHLIEDAAQAIGAEFEKSRIGSFGVAASFSLHPLKNLGVLGDGGFITTDSEEIVEKIHLLRNHGLVDRDHVAIWGYNSRLDELQARIANFRLSNLDKQNEKVIKIAETYTEGLTGVVRTPVITKNARSVFHNYIVTTSNRDELASFLKTNGVDTRVHYPIPIHLQSASSKLPYSQGSFPKAEKFAAESLSLPIYPSLTEAQVNLVIECVNRFFKKVQ